MSLLILIFAVIVLLSTLTITALNVSVQGQDNFYDQEGYNPDEQSQDILKRACYDGDYQDGKSGSFDEDRYDECEVLEDNAYEDGFNDGCTEDNSEEYCRALRLGLKDLFHDRHGRRY